VCQEIAELKSKTGAKFLAINQYQYGISAKFMHVAQQFLQKKCIVLLLLNKTLNVMACILI
jgi:hypothetical protein